MPSVFGRIVHNTIPLTRPRLLLVRFFHRKEGGGLTCELVRRSMPVYGNCHLSVDDESLGNDPIL